MDSNTYPNNIHEEYAVLINRAKSGDESAFSEIYEKAERYVYATCYGILHNKEDAEDAMQETFIAFFNNIDTILDGQAFVSWIHTTAYFKAVNIRDKKKDNLAYEDAIAANEISEEADDNLESLPESLIIDKTNRSIIKKILRDELNADQYDTVLLYYYNEMPVSTIAQVMDCPEGTVKKRLFASRAKIKAGIESYEKFHGDKLVGAAGVPFLTKFFTECANDLTLPAIKPISVKIPVKPNIASQTGQAAKSGNLAKNAGSTQAGAKAGFLSSPLAKIGIAVAAVIILAIPAAFAIKNLIDTKPAKKTEKTEEQEVEETEVTDTTENSNSSVILTDGIPFDQVPEFDQLSQFVYSWNGRTYDSEVIPDDISVQELLVSDQKTGLVDFSMYVDTYDLGPGIEDPESCFEKEYCYRITYNDLDWVESNILNMSEDDRIHINAVSGINMEVTGPDNGFYYELIGSTIYYAHSEAAAVDLKYTEVVKVETDDEFYYVTAQYCSSADVSSSSPEYCYYKMQLKNINGKDYWTLINCTNNPDFARTWDAPETRTVAVKTSQYLFTDGTDEALNQFYTTRYVYDESDNLLKETTYDQMDNVTGWIEYEYDSSNNLIRFYRYETIWKPMVMIQEWGEFKYDGSNNLIEKNLYGNCGTDFDHIIYEYDASNRLIKQTNYVKGDCYSWSEFEYDALGRMSIEHYWFADFESVGIAADELYTYVYEYDEYNNLIKLSPDPDNSAFGYAEYEYDSQNNKTKYTNKYPFDNVNYTVEYVYDENNNLIMKTQVFKDGNGSRTEYEYNYD